MAKKMFLGELLVAGGFLTVADLSDCLEISRSTGQRLGEVVVEKRHVTQEELLRVLENQHRVPYVDLDRADIPINIANCFPADLARHNVVVPVKIEDGTLYVAIDDPRNFSALGQVKTASQMPIKPMLASAKSIEAHIERVYGNEVVQRALSEYGQTVDYDSLLQQQAATITDDVGSAPIVRLVNTMLDQAVSKGASDIHVEPTSEDVRIRMRIDGVLYNVLRTPSHTLNAIVARIKIMGGMNIAEHRAAQDGRFNIKVMHKDVDVRVSIISTIHGEKAVMRLLDRSSFYVPKSRLGFTESNLEKFNRLLTTPHGIVLVTGPTGSGKSTTLYAMLSEMNNSRDNISTIEDPVEYVMDGINQVQVNPKAGLGFAGGLRAMLRQDPDIIMVGEIRDTETVEIAMRAAVTGHLVLSTLHTRDTVASVMRLTDMGVPPYMVASAVVGVVAQRLVRVICRDCKTQYQPTKAELNTAGIDDWTAQSTPFYKGVGCLSCGHLGYRGRTAVHEIIVFDGNIREFIHNSASYDTIKNYAIRQQGMVTLRDSTLELIATGKTTIDELITIVQGV
ncbi:MAG: Flp pilus assembly complex ATPase component TadA [Defluviitaleaceae bacterium]|nr:Flp pilus assembly complex ATPase component TadA [Defluviitaleaceae bacterium]